MTDDALDPTHRQLEDLRYALDQAAIVAITDQKGVSIITGDVHLLRSAVLNLALNAAEALDGAGSLTVEVRPDPNGCVLTVTDDGPGVPEELRERIFQPFFTTRATGIGLGLATVRRTVEQHGGDIVLESPAGGGTRFRITLPGQQRETV